MAQFERPASDDRAAPAAPRWERGLLVIIGALALCGLILVAASPAFTPAALIVLGWVVALVASGRHLEAAAGVAWQSPRAARLARLLGPILALGTTLALGLTHLALAGTAAEAGSLALLLLATGIILVIVSYAISATAASAAAIIALILVALVAVPRQGLVAEAIATGIASTAFWILLGIVAVGVGALILRERLAGDAASRRIPLGIYLLASLALIAWWRFGEPWNLFGALPFDFDRAAMQITLLALIAGTVAHVAITLLLPPEGGVRHLAADLATHLILLGLIVGAPIVAQRPPTTIEKQYNISWLALVVFAFIAVRSARSLQLLRHRAPGAPIGEWRVALALWVLCSAIYWPLGQWRYAIHSLTGDETQYIAATISLIRDRSFDLTNFLLDPNNGMASNLGYRQIDIYEDQSRDRMAFGFQGNPVTTAYLPLVGGEGMEATILILNPSIEAASATIALRGRDGRDLGTSTLQVAAGEIAFFPVPGAANEPQAAIITGGKPLIVSARAHDPARGDESYNGMVALNRSCIPVHPTGADWRGDLFVQNPLADAVRGQWQFFSAAGVASPPQQFTVPGGGLTTLQPTLAAELGTLCVAGDSPVASLLLVRDGAGVQVQVGQTGQSGRIALPEPPRGFAIGATSQVLVYNPSIDPITVSFSTEPGPVTIPPRGAHEVVISGGAPVGGQTEDRIDRTWVESEDSIVVSYLAATGSQRAAGAPNGRASKAITIPAITGGTNRYLLGHLQLTNNTDEPTMANAQLRGPQGRIIWENKSWVCANCIITHPFWYRDTAGGVLTIETAQPLAASLLQREVVASWPTHGVGPSIIAIPAYLLAGWSGILAFFGLVAAALVAVFYRLLRDCGVGRRSGLLVAALVACSAPLISYSAQFYPETGATLLLLVALRLSGAAQVRWPHWLGILLCLGAVPFFHARLLPLCLVLFAAACGRALWLWRGDRSGPLTRYWRRYGMVLGGIVILAGILAVVVSRDTRLQPGFLRNYLSLPQIVPHALGILLDNATGLLPCIPLLLIAGSGYSWLIRRAPYYGLTALALGLTQLLFVALRGDGWEVWGAPGRYILPALPFFAVALGACWERGFYRSVRLIVPLLAAWGLLVGAFYSWIPGGAYFVPFPYYWFADDITRAILGFNPLRLFPYLPSNIEPSNRTILLLVGVLLAGILLGSYWRPTWRRRDATAAAGIRATPQPSAEGD